MYVWRTYFYVSIFVCASFIKFFWAVVECSPTRPLLVSFSACVSITRINKDTYKILSDILLICCFSFILSFSLTLSLSLSLALFCRTLFQTSKHYKISPTKKNVVHSQLGILRHLNISTEAKRILERMWRLKWRRRGRRRRRRRNISPNWVSLELYNTTIKNP